MEDIKACCAIYSAVNSNRILNLAGETTLCELADELASCSLVIGNDTGSMHLANMLGTPVSVLFGPTNSTHTQPFFNSALTLIEPENSTDINSIKVADVIEAISEHIPS
jgi:ADP-heptose:LPS heptosyltransferase